MGIGLDEGIETYISDQRVVAGQPNFVFVFTPHYIWVAEFGSSFFFKIRLYEENLYVCGRGKLLSILLFYICVAVNECRIMTNQSINGFVCF